MSCAKNIHPKPVSVVLIPRTPKTNFVEIYEVFAMSLRSHKHFHKILSVYESYSEKWFSFSYNIFISLNYTNCYELDDF